MAVPKVINLWSPNVFSKTDLLYVSKHDLLGYFTFSIITLLGMGRCSTELPIYIKAIDQYLWFHAKGFDANEVFTGNQMELRKLIDLILNISELQKMYQFPVKRTLHSLVIKEPRRTKYISIDPDALKQQVMSMIINQHQINHNDDLIENLTKRSKTLSWVT